MKIHYTIILLLIVFIANAQSNNDKINKQTSAMVGTGINLFAVKDNNISNEKYSGMLIPINFKWRNNITDNQFRDFYFEIQNGTIKNQFVKAQVWQLYIGWDYGYKLNKNQTYDIFLGPAPNFKLYFRQQEIASNKDAISFINTISLASIFGIKSNNISKFNYNFTGRLGLLTPAYTLKEKPKVLTPFNGLQFYFSSVISYELSDWFDLGIAYSFQMCRITEWNLMYSLSDQITLNLLFSF